MKNLNVFDVESRSSVFPAGKSAGSVLKPAALPTGVRRRIPTENRYCVPNAENLRMAMNGTENFAVTPASIAGLRRRGEAEMRSMESHMCAFPHA